MMNWSVDELIPQKAPFVFIDEVIEFAETSITTSFEVKPEACFVADGKLQEAGLIENMAQTAAALEGCNAKHKDEKVKVGFIGSVKQLKIHQVALVGQVLTTTIKVVTNAMGINVVDGEVKIDDYTIASCTLNIFLQE